MSRLAPRDHWPAWKWTKRALCGLVVAVQGVALLSSDPAEQLPYFPIEVSRTAATTAINRWLFPAGVLSLVPVAHWADGATIEQFRRFGGAWLGLLTVAWFDDCRHPLLHAVGVAAMALGLVYARNYARRFSWWNAPRHNKHLLQAGALYAWRVLLKVITVAALELSAGSAWWSPLAIGRRAHEIMQGVAPVLYPRATLNVFRLCGVLQWLVFVLLGNMLP
jgi:hypothetical protein